MGFWKWLGLDSGLTDSDLALLARVSLYRVIRFPHMALIQRGKQFEFYSLEEGLWYHQTVKAVWWYRGKYIQNGGYFENHGRLGY